MLILKNGKWEKSSFDMDAFFMGHEECYEYEDVRIVVYDDAEERTVLYDNTFGVDEAPNTLGLLKQLNPAYNTVWVRRFNVTTCDNGSECVSVIADDGFAEAFSRDDRGDWL